MIRRSLLSYVRAQEESADRAGVKFLNATQQSAKGMYTTFKRFADDQLVISSRIDPYQQTHPMPRERMAVLEDLIKTNGYWDKTDTPELQLRHDLMRLMAEAVRRRIEALVIVNNRAEGNAPATIRALAEMWRAGPPPCPAGLPPDNDQ